MRFAGFERKFLVHEDHLNAPPFTEWRNPSLDSIHLQMARGAAFETINSAE